MSRPARRSGRIDDPKVESLLHLHNTRASRRAVAVARTHSAVRARRPELLLSTLTGALLGITLTVGVVSAPASGAESAQGGPINFVASLISPGALPLSEIADSADSAFREGQEAVAAADALTADVTASGLDVGSMPTTIDTADLEGSVDELRDRAVIPALLLGDLTDQTVAGTREVMANTVALQQAFGAAKAEKAAADAAQAAAEAERIAAEQAAAQAAADAAALAAGNTVDGAKATAQALASSRYGWGADQFSCLSSLWTKESGWNYQAYNSDGGATGIPQALPGDKMASAGSDWQTNAATQISWGLDYISRGYGSPCSAWSHSQAMNWY